MKNQKLIWFVLLLIFVPLLFLQPDAAFADAETVAFRVVNKSEGPLRIQLQGPKTYYLEAPIGTSKHEVIPGSYTYGYLAYGTYVEGKLEILKDGVQLTISSQAVKILIKNKTGVALMLRLAGPQTKNISLPPGNTRVDLWKGSYEYSYTAYGIYKSGKIEFQTNKDSLELEKLTANLNIQNTSGAQVILSLSGTRYYNLTIPTGKTKVEVIKGKYQYSYLDHGVYETGEINVQGEQDLLTLPNNIATLRIVNKTGADVRITLQGKVPYFLSAAAGNSRHIIRRGNYEASYYACGAWQSSDLKVDKNAFDFTIPSCYTPTAGGVKVIIVNDTHGMVTIHLTGPQEYWFYLPAGRQTIEVVKGTYDYTVWGCGDSMSGSKKITSKFEWRFWCW